MVYKFSPASELALENLREGQFYCRHFEDYNDPFELWFNVESGLPELDHNNLRFQKAVTAWGFPNLRKEDLPLDEEIWKEYFGSLAEGAPAFSFDHARITCFSDEINNLLMWSHYADGLRGFCIEFNESEIFEEDSNIFLVDVNYTNKPPLIDTLEYAVIQDQYDYAVEHGYEEYEGELRRFELNEIIRTAVASKPKEWEYEKERRLVIITPDENKQPILHKYPLKSIKAIILGEKMDADFKVKISQILFDLGLPIETRMAIRSKDTYKIDIVNSNFQ